MMDKAAVTKVAHKYIAKGELDKAIAELQKLLKDDQDAGIYNMIGDLYLRKTEKENAIEMFKKAANIFRESGFYLKAIALYKKVLNINPSEVSTLILLGELNAERGLMGNANENFSRAADIFLKQGADENVLDVYKKMLKYFPSDISLKMKVAEFSEKLGITEGAVREYTGIAAYHLNREEINEAQEFYLKAVGLDPKSVAALLGLSRIAELQNNIQQAFEYAKNVLSIVPNNSEVLLNYSRLAVRLGDINEGKQSLVRLVETDPSNNEYKKLLGNLYLKEGLLDKAWEYLLPYIDEKIHLKEWDEAIKRLMDFMDLDPVAVKRRLVTLYKAKGENELAVKEVRKLAGFYEGKNLLDNAAQSYREILELIPSDESAQKRLKEIEELQHKEEAVLPVITPPEQVPESDEAARQKKLEEGLSEAEFYVQQGFTDEAIKVYERLYSLFPDNKEIAQKMEALKKPSAKEKDKEKSRKGRVSYI